MQGEYEAAKTESEAADAELKALKSKRPAQLAAYIKAREVQAGFIAPLPRYNFSIFDYTD